MMFNGRSAKPWGSFREGAANLDMVASDSRISKATRVIMLASFSLMKMTRMEVAVADPIVTQQVFQFPQRSQSIGATHAFSAFRRC